MTSETSHPELTFYMVVSKRAIPSHHSRRGLCVHATKNAVEHGPFSVTLRWDGTKTFWIYWTFTIKDDYGIHMYIYIYVYDICICICIWICICIYIHMYIHIYVYTYMYMYTHICIHIYVYVHVHVYVYVYVYVCVYVYMYTYIHTCMHSYIHASMHPSIHPSIHTYIFVVMVHGSRIRVPVDPLVFTFWHQRFVFCNHSTGVNVPLLEF